MSAAHVFVLNSTAAVSDHLHSPSRQACAVRELACIAGIEISLLMALSEAYVVMLRQLCSRAPAAVAAIVTLPAVD
jgi:hypothetical protein